jgi:hypothetical protein
MKPLFSLFAVVVLLFTACKDKSNPPAIQLKTDGSYVSSSIVVAPGSSFLVGVICTKTTDELHLLYTEYAYDGANTGTFGSRTYIGPNDRSRFEKDYTITTRNQPGNERWIFNVNDQEGCISKVEIKITVQ